MLNPNAADEILKATLSRQAWFLDRLKGMAELESPPHRAEMHEALFEFITDELRSLDYIISLYPGTQSGGQLLARPAASESSCYQLMLGHIDTVWPEGTLNRMPIVSGNDYLSGPGVYDMKAGVLMMITALLVIRDLGLIPSLSPVIFLNSDEETGSRESRSRIERLAKAMDRVFVLEPSLERIGKLKTRRKGVGHFEIEVSGISSHAGLEPEKGRSAIFELSFLIQKLFELNDPENGITVNVGKIDGGISTNVVAPSSSAHVDVRVLNSIDARKLDQQIRNLQPSTPDVSLHIKGGFGRPPMEKTKGNEILWEAARRCGSLMGLELKEGISGGASDGNFTSPFTPTLDGLGAVGEGAHSPNEKVFIQETLQRTALLGLLLLLPDHIALAAQTQSAASIHKA